MMHGQENIKLCYENLHTFLFLNILLETLIFMISIYLVYSRRAQ